MCEGKASKDKRQNAETRFSFLALWILPLRREQREPGKSEIFLALPQIAGNRKKQIAANQKIQIAATQIKRRPHGNCKKIFL
ncbi:MAG: hypothetical protein K2O03_05365 [Lachnospiraceae bacterium]|nr:hypothetical protein [Lachnospiraceae bacterium]